MYTFIEEHQKAISQQSPDLIDLRTQINALIDIHFSSLQYLKDKISVTSSIPEMVNTILIGLKKQLNSISNQFNNHIKGLERRLERDEHESLSYKLKIDELEKENISLTGKIYRIEKQYHRKEDDEFELKSKIQELEKQMLMVKKDYHLRIKQSKLKLQRQNQMIAELENQHNIYQQQILSLSQSRQVGVQNRKKAVSISVPRSHQNDFYDSRQDIMKEIKELKDSQSLLLDKLAEKDEIIDKLRDRIEI